MTLFNTIIMRATIRLGQVVWLVGIIEIAIEIAIEIDLRGLEPLQGPSPPDENGPARVFVFFLSPARAERYAHSFDSPFMIQPSRPTDHDPRGPSPSLKGEKT